MQGDARQGDVVLPAFEMDCRQWLVATPNEAGLPDEIAGAPLLAVLSTAVFDDTDFRSASAVLTVGLLDDDAPSAGPAGDGCVATELLEVDGGDPRSLRYVVACPSGRLALLAEFTLAEGASADPELVRRIEALMASFRWAG